VVPLKTEDLSLMMHIERESGTIEADTIFMPETIQSICGNLLIYDRQSDVWRFSHLSAREYIEKYHYSMLESHHHVAISSIKFLQRYSITSLRKLRSIREPWCIVARKPSHPDVSHVKHTVQCHYIFHYVFWHTHELDLPTFVHSELSNLLHDFFEPISEGSSSFKSWKRLVKVGEIFDYRVRLRYRVLSFIPLSLISKRLTPLQVMSSYGLFHILKDLWEKAGGELDICHQFTPSPLTLAIQKGHESIWRFILLAKAKLNTGTPGPLAAAIEHNNEKAFEALIEAGADVNYVPFDKHLGTAWVDTPLKVALPSSIKQNRRYIIQRLLDAGADVNLRSGGRTAMELAIESADEETVKLLLDANRKVYNPNHFLSLAAQNLKSNLVPLFVSLGANVEEPWEGVLPLVWALRTGNILVVQYLLEIPGISIDMSCQDHREAMVSHLGRGHGPTDFPFLFGSNPYINWVDCERITLSRALLSYPKYDYELHGLGLNSSQFALQCIEGTAQRQLSLVDTLLRAGPDPSVSVNFGSGITLTAAAFLGRLHHVRHLLDCEMIRDEQEQRALFRIALFAIMSGHLGIVSRIPPDGKWRPPVNDCLCERYLEVLIRLFDGDLSSCMPIYDFLDPLIPLLYVNGRGYEINRPCRLYTTAYFGCFSRFWVSIMWDIRNSIAPQMPLGSQLRQWQFPGTLPDRCFIVTKVTAISTARPAYFIMLSICGSRSQFNIVSAPKRVCMPLSQKSEDGRWKKYKPESFGVARFTDPDVGIDSGNTKAPVSRGNLKSNPSSWYGNMITFVLLAFVVGLLSFFIALL
jgi:ankyrin repeat protein